MLVVCKISSLGVEIVTCFGGAILCWAAMVLTTCCTSSMSGGMVLVSGAAANTSCIWKCFVWTEVPHSWSTVRWSGSMLVDCNVFTIASLFCGEFFLMCDCRIVLHMFSFLAFKSRIANTLPTILHLLLQCPKTLHAWHCTLTNGLFHGFVFVLFLYVFLVVLLLLLFCLCTALTVRVLIVGWCSVKLRTVPVIFSRENLSGSFVLYTFTLSICVIILDFAWEYMSLCIPRLGIVLIFVLLQGCIHCRGSVIKSNFKDVIHTGEDYLRYLGMVVCVEVLF